MNRLFCWLFVVFATVAVAAEPPPMVNPENPGKTPEQMPDVPEIAQWEITRRGNMAQETGTVQAGEIDAIADALSPPEDDSHKWFLSVVSMDGCPACERLKADFIKSPVLQSWVNVDEPSRSVFHYQVRRIEDETQKDWLKNLKPRLEKGGFPAIVIQPPKNGEFGPNKTVVAVLHGYDGDAEKLTKKLRESIVFYIQTIKRKGLLTHVGENAARVGIRQPPVIGIDPPFKVPDKKVDPFQPNGPSPDWPPPQGLTLDQLRNLCPDAPPEFLLEQINKKATDPNVVKLEWLVYQTKHPTTPAKPEPTPDPITPAPTPTTPTGFPWLTVVALVMAGNIPGLIALGLVWFRKSQVNQGRKPMLNDAEFQALLGLTDGLDKKDLENLLLLLRKKLNPETPMNPTPVKA